MSKIRKKIRLHAAHDHGCPPILATIVYAIVSDSGGAIDVKSAVNQGSTFAVYLPLVKV